MRSRRSRRCLYARGTSCRVDGAHREALVLERRVGNCPWKGIPTASSDGRTIRHPRRGRTQQELAVLGGHRRNMCTWGRVPSCRRGIGMKYLGYSSAGTRGFSDRPPRFGERIHPNVPHCSKQARLPRNCKTLPSEGLSKVPSRANGIASHARRRDVVA